MNEEHTYRFTFKDILIIYKQGWRMRDLGLSEEELKNLVKREWNP